MIKKKCECECTCAKFTLLMWKICFACEFGVHKILRDAALSGGKP